MTREEMINFIIKEKMEVYGIKEEEITKEELSDLEGMNNEMLKKEYEWFKKSQDELFD